MFISKIRLRMSRPSSCRNVPGPTRAFCATTMTKKTCCNNFGQEGVRDTPSCLESREGTSVPLFQRPSNEPFPHDSILSNEFVGHSARATPSIFRNLLLQGLAFVRVFCIFHSQSILDETTLATGRGKGTLLVVVTKQVFTRVSELEGAHQILVVSAIRLPHPRHPLTTSLFGESIRPLSQAPSLPSHDDPFQSVPSIPLWIVPRERDCVQSEPQNAVGYDP